MIRLWLACLVVVALSLVTRSWAAEGGGVARDALKAAQAKGNFKDAYEGLSKLLLATAEGGGDTGEAAAEDVRLCTTALQRLGRVSEFDALIEGGVAAHPKDVRVLWAAADMYRMMDHSGAIVAGKFYRGGRRGGDGKYVNALLRDRVRSLQLMEQAIGVAPDAGDEAGKKLHADLYWSSAEMLLNGYTGHEAWRFGTLTDLATLPDYEEGYGNRWYSYGAHGAPVDENGNPIFYKMPKGWKEAQNDGERWRWCLAQAAEFGGKAMVNRTRWELASFLHEQFGVQTMAYYGYGFFGRTADDSKKDESGPLAVSTLGEDETITRLATGIKRFKLPDEFNFIKICRTILADPERSVYGENATDLLGQVFENRQEYITAADEWRKGIARFGAGNIDRVGRLKQIEGNWGTFESNPAVPAGKDAAVGFKFRNGKKVTVTALEIDIDRLLEDVKAFIRTKPNRLDWERVDLSNIGYRLVTRDQKKYAEKEVAKWDVTLDPPAKHFDRRVQITTPLKKAGAYLLKSEMEGGNTTFMVLWVADTAIVKKPLDKGVFTYVADAVTGKPVAGAALDFFGYRQQWVKDNNYKVEITEGQGKTSDEGQYVGEPGKFPPEYSYLITAKTAEGRFAYLGFTSMWYGSYSDNYDYQYKQVKPYFITDRPVYRPGQTVKWKLWVNRAQYDQDGKSDFAGQTLPVHMYNPKGEKFKEYALVADEFGGVAGEYTLEKDATLGVYGIQHPSYGGINFRVEEYKKPEFEVKVDAPAEPVMLGDKIAATITAKYYFGAPVVNAKVKYKITRTSYSANWYPSAYWDWYFEPGYWWFAYDYAWYPGWSEWGMRRPHFWWHHWASPQPEIVSESEVPVGADGTVKVDIDTATAKAIHGDTDHKYEITAEVTDESRRVITGTGSVLVARKPFQVYAWIDCGYAHVGDVVQAHFSAQTLDHKPVAGKGVAKLFKVSYDKDGKPAEKELAKWDVDPNAEGTAALQIRAGEAGQFRVSYSVTDAKGRAIEGAYVFVIHGPTAVAKDASFRFDDIELIPEKKEYKAGETVRLMVNTNREDATVLLFVRPANGVYLPPKMLHLQGKSSIVEIGVTRKDMPNFFVEACVVYNANVYNDMKEIVVPPEDRVLKVTVTPSAKEYKPGEKAKVKIEVKEANGEPFNGSAVVSMYDKAVEYISGGSNVQDIRTFFWKWRRHHSINTESSLSRGAYAVTRNGDPTMATIGVFGNQSAELLDGLAGPGGGFGGGGRLMADAAAAPMSMARGNSNGMQAAKALGRESGEPAEQQSAQDRDGKDKSGELRNRAEEAPAGVEPTVRKNFADTALWVAAVNTDKAGSAEVELTMPENLSTWKTKVWTLGAGTRVGQGEAEVVTTKKLIVRLQAPRFFVTTDEVVLSANVHNYLKTKKDVKVVLELDGATLTPMAPGDQKALIAKTWDLVQHVALEPNSEKRVDWQVHVQTPGTAVVRMKAITDEESDATEMSFPVFIHGMLKTDSFSGAIRPADSTASVSFKVPLERLEAQSRLEIRYSPSLALAMVDALPYMVEYPYGCTEQTLNRFLPTVITQKILTEMKIDLAAVKEKRTNLNAQEIGDPSKRAAQWQRFKHNAVFDKAEVSEMVKSGAKSLANMQLSDGGWGWFSGYGEYSYPHTTAVVVHGLQLVRANDQVIDNSVLDRGVAWLRNYQAQQVTLLNNWGKKDVPQKQHADALDALVYMVLTDAGSKNEAMRDFLYRDRIELPVYAKAVYGLALHKLGEKDKLEMILQNISQFVVQDAENQTAYLKLPEDNYWWCWYGTDTEANAFYLKLLAKTDPKGAVASGLAKYLINNRKHATYWNSTRDSAYCIEALADYIRASGEDMPDMTLEVALDGKKLKEVKIDASNLFTFDGSAVLEGADVKAGEHKIELTRKGTGPVYFNAYATNFTLEDHITKAGLEIKVNRKLYKLTPVDKKIKAEGSRGQAVDEKVEKYRRDEVLDMGTLKSGDLCEMELEIDSKNDYEYIMFEDMKAAGFEPVEVRSGYNGNDMHAYVEFRDERVCFFARTLARGKHSVSYRLRAEIPGKFSALPAKSSGMYAPELRANSDEIKVRVVD